MEWDAALHQVTARTDYWEDPFEVDDPQPRKHTALSWSSDGKLLTDYDTYWARDEETGERWLSEDYASFCLVPVQSLRGTCAYMWAGHGAEYGADGSTLWQYAVTLNTAGHPIHLYYDSDGDDVFEGDYPIYQEVNAGGTLAALYELDWSAQEWVYTTSNGEDGALYSTVTTTLEAIERAVPAP